jgi:hypothetical protein
MKTFQIIMRNGLTRSIAAELVEKDEKVIDFKVRENTIALLRTDAVLRVEAFDDGAYHEIIFLSLQH